MQINFGSFLAPSPLSSPEGEGTGGYLISFYTGRLHGVLTHCPFIYHFWRKRYPFPIPSTDKWSPFQIPCLERGIPFNCPFSPLSTEYQISLPLHVPQLVKSLPFHIPETWKGCPLRAESLRTDHYREYPPDPLSSVLSIYCDSKEKKRDCDTFNRNTQFFFAQEALSLEFLVNEHYLGWRLRNFPFF